MGDLYEAGEQFVRRARSAKDAVGAPGTDASGAVSVTLDPDGRVAAVSVVAGWPQRVSEDRLGEAVRSAVQNAVSHRVAAWGESYASGAGESSSAPDPFPERAELQRRLRAAASGQMSGEDLRAALGELLAMARDIEQGLDEVSAKLRSTLGAAHTGRSPDRHVTVSMTGGGEVTAVRFEGSWLRQAHEINIGRQATAAFRAAYAEVAAHGVQRLIADSPLGAVQRAGQDPLGLARRLRVIE